MAVKKQIDADAKTITFTFENGDSATYNLGDLSPEIQTRLALHGLSQKLGDSYASAKDEAPARVAGVWETLSKGEWTSRSEGGAPRVTQLARAIAQVMGAPIEGVVAKLADMEADQKKAIAASPDVAAALAEIKLADLQKRKEELAAKAAEAPTADLSAFAA